MQRARASESASKQASEGRGGNAPAIILIFGQAERENHEGRIDKRSRGGEREPGGEVHTQSAAL